MRGDTLIKKGIIKRNKSNLYIIIILAGIAAVIYFGLLKRGERVVHSIQADEVESIYLYMATCVAKREGNNNVLPTDINGRIFYSITITV